MKRLVVLAAIAAAAAAPQHAAAGCAPWCLPLGQLQPRWAADGTKLAYMQGGGSLPSEGAIANADGSAPQVVPDLRSPLSLAPDFTRFATFGYGATWTVVTEDAPAGPQHPLAAASTSTFPVWSPRGDRIAFVASDGAVAVVDADGSNLRELTTPVTPATGLWWSPDGTDLAVSLGRTAGAMELWVLPADGSTPRRLYSRPSSSVGWSPDGARLAFTAYTGDEPSPSLFVVNRDGSGLAQLASDAIASTSSAGTPPSGPSWSPDGTRIAYSSLLGVSIYDLRTGIGHVVADGHDPVWSPDGATLAYSDWGGCDKSGIVLSAPDGSDWRKITGDCRIFGTSGPDTLLGTSATDQIYGGAGNDVLDGSWGDDALYGGAGNDKIVGGPGVDVAYGGPGDDTIEANTIFGGPGRDRLTVAGDWPAYIYAVDGERDAISCGRSRRDVVYADRIDRVGPSCERVVRR